GSLLKIEEDLQQAVRQGQEEWEEKYPLFRVTEFAVGEAPKERYYRFVPGDVEGQRIGFWDLAEQLVLEALRDYAAGAEGGGGWRGRGGGGGGGAGGGCRGGRRGGGWGWGRWQKEGRRWC